LRYIAVRVSVASAPARIPNPGYWILGKAGRLFGFFVSNIILRHHVGHFGEAVYDVRLAALPPVVFLALKPPAVQERQRSRFGVFEGFDDGKPHDLGSDR